MEQTAGQSSGLLLFKYNINSVASADETNELNV